MCILCGLHSSFFHESICHKHLMNSESPCWDKIFIFIRYQERYQYTEFLIWMSLLSYLCLTFFLCDTCSILNDGQRIWPWKVLWIKDISLFLPQLLQCSFESIEIHLVPCSRRYKCYVFICYLISLNLICIPGNKICIRKFNKGQFHQFLDNKGLIYVKFQYLQNMTISLVVYEEWNTNDCKYNYLPIALYYLIIILF